MSARVYVHTTHPSVRKMKSEDAWGQSLLGEGRMVSKGFTHTCKGNRLING